MHTFFLCVFVVALFTSQIHGAGYNKNTQRDEIDRSQLLIREFDPYVNETCNCQSARNDYTYHNTDCVRDNIDPAYHYQTSTNMSTTWNCGLCRIAPILITSTQCVQCSAAIFRYIDDYKVANGQFDDYRNTWNVTGRYWHCELCVMRYEFSCAEARMSYSNQYPATAHMDPLFHYITYGVLQPLQFQWPGSLCGGGTTTWPEKYNCTIASILYRSYHPDLWNSTSPFEHYLKNHLAIGWPWNYLACTGDLYYLPWNFDCWAARFMYWSNYPDVLGFGLDPVFHYEAVHKSEPWRLWNGDLCEPGRDGIAFYDTACSCPASVELFTTMYNPDLTPSKYATVEASIRTFYYWAQNYRETGAIWHCELCSNVVTRLYTEPDTLLMAETCVAARQDYLARYPEIVGYDPVWHYENIGYDERRFWDGSKCAAKHNPLYYTGTACQNCVAAKEAYVNQYEVARSYYDPYEHWRAFYISTNTSDHGYLYPCAELCDLTSTATVTPTPVPTLAPTPTPNATPLPSTTTTTLPVDTSTTSPTSSSTTANSVAPTSKQSSGTSTSDSLKSSDDGGNKLETTAVLAIVIPIVAVLSVGLGMLFIHQQRRQAVQALIKAEEGERRNYKIDFMSLSVDWLIGSGSFGHVYRGEYRGADVAIKKLKKQNMGNQQLEDLAKEAMVMVGLRHPNIVLFMGVCLERPELCIVTEYMPRGNLYDVLHDKTIKLPFSVIRNMALHVVKGLQFIHSAGMIHRDLKSPNLLVDSNWTIKIADFGLSCAKSQVTEEVQISLLWTAPEILMREKNCYSDKSDVYSLGIILWELMSRQTPFSEFLAAAIPPAIVIGKRPPVHNDWNGTFKVLMAQCWEQTASHRPLVRDVRQTLESIIHDSDGKPPSVRSSVSTVTTAASHDVELSERSNYPPRGDVTLVFTDVENSATLWEADPQVMLVALRLHNETCRKLLREYGGYEAQTEGDASMLAFSDPVSAVNYCVAAQLALLKVDWPADLLKQQGAREEWSDTGTRIYNGLRIRMGIHCGEPHCEQDQITYRTEYFGPVVSFASRVASHAVGGQIVATGEVYERISGTFARLVPCVADQLGTCHVKGTQETVLLYQIYPKELRARGVQPVLDLTTQGTSAGGSVHSSQTTSSSSSSSDKYAWSLRHNEKWIINYDDLELDVVIGTGSFGDVFAGTWNGQRVAIKQFMKQKVTDEVLLEMRTESGILSAIEHPNIIRFLGMCIKIPHLCIVTELLDRGSLSTILLGNETLSWAQRKSFAIDIAKGLEYLHKNNIIHRDVKSPNMLVAADWTIKIADFGFSRVKSENHTMTQCGTVAWTAPEIFLGERYSEKADVYSYSVILWELVFRKKPWQGMNSMKVCHSVENGERLSIQNQPSGTPEFVIKLMEACWLQDHEQRPSFTAVLQFLDEQKM